MKAVRRTEAGIEVVDVPEPDGPGVVVEMRAAGICGSDLKIIEWGPMPSTLGHELAGLLDDGTAVAIEPLTPCEECDQCLAGQYQRCRTSGLIGMNRDGGMADRVLVPERCLVPLSAGVPVADASLVEPLAVAVHGFGLAELDGSQRVGVVGGGTIGLCATAAARAAGCEVGMVARHAHQVAAAERLGAAPADGEYDVVVEAAGSESSIAEAAERCAPGGAIAVLGVYAGTLPVPGLPALSKELRIVSSMTYGVHGAAREIDAAAALLAARPEIADTLITHRFPLADAAEAFRVAGSRADGAIKVVLEPA